MVGMNRTQQWCCWWIVLAVVVAMPCLMYATYGAFDVEPHLDLLDMMIASGVAWLFYACRPRDRSQE
jgi:hypothetical protein